MRNIIGNKPTQQTQVFGSWDEFVGYVEETPSDMEIEKRASYSAKEQRSREQHEIVKYWGGEYSMEIALTKARKGWKEGAAEILKTLNDFQIPAKRVVQEIAFSPVGPGTLDMGRYIQGHPQSWMVWQDTETTNDQMTANGGVVRLGINISQSGGVSATTRFQTGALILSLIDLLERSNRRVELTLYNAVSGRDGAYIRQQVLVKEANSPVNPSILAFAFANAATQRRLCFAVRETLDAETRNACSITWKGCMGQTDPEWHGIDSHGITTLTGIGSATCNQEARVQWLQAQLKEQGIEWDGK